MAINYDSKSEYLNCLKQIEKAVGHIFTEEANTKIIEVLCTYAQDATIDSQIREEIEVFLEDLYMNDKK